MYVWMAWRLREARNTWGRKIEVVVARDERREAESGKTGQWINREKQRAGPSPGRLEQRSWREMEGERARSVHTLSPSVMAM